MLYEMVAQLKFRRYLPPAIVLLLIAGLSASFVYFRRYSPYKVSALLAGNPEIILSLRGVEMVGRSEGQRLWSFRAERADVARGQIRTTFVAIRDGKLYDEGKVVATVEAGRAVYDSATDNVDVSDGVTVASPRGYRASAQSARWSAYFKRLWCPGKVSFRAGDNELVGSNLIADMRNQEVRLSKAKMVVSIRDVEELGKGSPEVGKGRGQ